MRSQKADWILVAAFLAVSLFNLVFNPFAVRQTRASINNCTGPEPECDSCETPECDNGSWVCVQQQAP